MIADLIFYMLSFFLLLGALGVVWAKNPMYSVLFLILAFFNASGLFLLLGAEFVALLIVMVYVGAIAVMFLFVIMTINVDFEVMKEGYTSYLPMGVLVAALLALEIGMAVSSGVFIEKPATSALGMPVEPEVSNIVNIGNVLFTDYLLPFQAAGLILLIAMIGAIVLAHRKRGDVRRQKVGDQIARKRSDSLAILEVPSGKGTAEIKWKER